MDSFINLHLHTDASLGDSIITVPSLVQKLQEYQQEYCAITDHGSLMNHYSFQQACIGADIKPLFGNELYCKTTMEKPTSQSRYHLVLIAMNETGLINLRKLQRLSVADHFYYKPLTPHELIFENTEGLFCSTACALSYINYNFLHNNDDEAYNFFNKLLDTFGKSNVAIELQYHPTWKTDGIRDYPQNYLNEKLINLYDNTDAQWIINTFDSHVLTDKGRPLRKKIQSINWKKNENDISDTLKSNVLGTTELSYQYGRESEVDDDIIQLCVNNTHKIAKKIYFQPKQYQRVIPKFDKHAHFKKIFLKKVV